MIVGFQSLGRDSVGFSLSRVYRGGHVAIEFQSLGRDSVGFSAEEPRRASATRWAGFNPSVGILWGLAPECGGHAVEHPGGFNPSVGILWGLALLSSVHA